jgi:hypothetical protein
MLESRFFLPPALLLAALGAARADDKVLVRGYPPLTQGMVDDYCRYVAWRSPQALDTVGGPQRLGQLVVNTWRNGDRARQNVILAELKWWWEDFPRLSAAGRERLVAGGPAPRPAGLEQNAIHRLLVQQWDEARQQQIRALTDLQASHHETVMRIIDNMRPSGRYEYDPVTGRNDRYVPRPPRR